MSSSMTYNILATKSHKIFEHIELPGLIIFFFINDRYVNFMNLKVELLHFRTHCIYNKEQTNSMPLYQTRNIMFIKYQPKETFIVSMTNLTEQKGPSINSKKRNAMKCSGKEQQTLIFLKLARFAWSEHLELSMSEIESYSCTMVRTRYN